MGQSKRHLTAEITLLCDQHHREKTSGLLPVERVREADRNPCNLRSGVSAGYDLHYSGNCNFIVGGCNFTFLNNQPTAVAIVIAIRNVPLLAFSFEDGQGFITIQIFNSAGDRVLWIDRNELRYRVDTWDIRFVGQLLQIREGDGNILFEVRFSPPDRVEVLRGYLQLFGFEIFVRPDALYYLNTGHVFQSCGFGFSHAGLVVDPVGSTSSIELGGNAHFRERSREEIVGMLHQTGHHFALVDGRFVFQGADSPPGLEKPGH